MTELRPQIFFYLKSHGPSKLGDIAHNITGFPAAVVTQEIENLIKAGLLKKDSDNYLRISLYLDAPRKEFRKDGLYNYQLIQEKKQIVPAQQRPPVWINEHVYLLPQRDQGDRGTCVGQATAYAADLNAIRLTDWRPDLTQTQRNVVVESNGIRFVKDELPAGCASAECAFIVSREIGGVRKEQFGSFLDFSVKAWQKQGICTESLWWNPKSANLDNYEAIPTDRTKALRQSELHTIDGYATTVSFEDVKDAIYNNGFVLMAINIFDNWLENNCEGLFPDPKGNMIGSHALCWVGYDEDNLYCLHSWASWSLLGGISRKYFDIAHLTAFVPLDSMETNVAKEHYAKLTVTTDILSNIKINNDTFRKTKRATGAFDPGTSIEITVSPSLPGLTEQTKIITIREDTEIPFTFMPQSMCSFNDIMARIKSFLEALWK